LPPDDDDGGCVDDAGIVSGSGFLAGFGPSLDSNDPDDVFATDVGVDACGVDDDVVGRLLRVLCRRFGYFHSPSYLNVATRRPDFVLVIVTGFFFVPLFPLVLDRPSVPLLPVGSAVRPLSTLIFFDGTGASVSRPPVGNAVRESIFCFLCAGNGPSAPSLSGRGLFGAVLMRGDPWALLASDDAPPTTPPRMTFFSFFSNSFLSPSFFSLRIFLSLTGLTSDAACEACTEAGTGVVCLAGAALVPLTAEEDTVCVKDGREGVGDGLEVMVLFELPLKTIEGRFWGGAGLCGGAGSVALGGAIAAGCVVRSATGAAGGSAGGFGGSV
jgi:hypothetical protein